MQEIEIWSDEQMVYAQPRIRPRELDAHCSLGFWDTNRLLNLGQTTSPNDSQQQQKIKPGRIVDFAIPVE